MKVYAAPFVLSSDIIPREVAEQLAESSNITWGDTNRTLISTERIVEELNNLFGYNDDPEQEFILTNVIDAIEALPKGIYIDMEN